MRLIHVALSIAAVVVLCSAAPANATLTYASDWQTEGLSLWAARDDGSQAHTLFKSKPGVLVSASSHVSPDGRLVAYERPRSPGSESWLGVIDARGGLTRFLAQDARFLAWSPDSRTIAAVTPPATIGTQQIILIDVHSGIARTLVEATDVKGASFSPRGLQLAYAAGPGLSSGLFTISVNGGPSYTIDDGHRSQWPVWGRSWIAFTRWRQTARRPELALAKADGTNVRVVSHTYHPSILPVDVSQDGKRFLVEVWHPGPYAAAYDLTTGRLRPIGRAESRNIAPSAISDDGRVVLGTRRDAQPRGGSDVVTLPFTGGPVRTLVRHAEEPSWSR